VFNRTEPRVINIYKVLYIVSNMYNKNLFYLFVFIFFLLFVNLSYSFIGGNGSLGSPYQISNCTHLKNMSLNLSASYIQVSDIDCGVSPYNLTSGFTPIGTNGAPFTGTFNGSNYVIDNFYISRSGTNYVGLFGRLQSGGIVSNVFLTNIDVTGNSYTGALVGRNDGSVLYSSSSGFVNGGAYTGGLVGHNGNLIKFSYSNSKVTGGANTGGLSGYNSYATVENSYATGNVIGGVSTGGLIGDAAGGSIKNVFATGNVTGSSRVGGLFGWGAVTLTNAYYIGVINATGSSVGGITGYIHANRNYNNVFAIAKMYGGTTNLGLAVGERTNGNFNNIYVLNTSNNYDSNFGAGAVAGVNTIQNDDYWFYNMSNEPFISFDSTWNLTNGSLPSLNNMPSPFSPVVVQSVSLNITGSTNFPAFGIMSIVFVFFIFLLV
jgi:hypothetical protein